MTWSEVYDKIGCLEEDRLLWKLLLGERDRYMCTLAQASDLLEGERYLDHTRHAQAMLYAVNEGEQHKPLTLYTVLKIHQFAFPFGGHFREGIPIIFNSKFEPPAPPVSPYVQDWIERWWYGSLRNTEIEYYDIAVAHLRFEEIHPFADGNGRVGRILNNYMCAYVGLPLLNICDRETYLRCMQQGDVPGLVSLFKCSVAYS